MDRSHWCRAHDPGLDYFKRAFVISPFRFTNGDSWAFKLKAKGKGNHPAQCRARRLLDWTQATLAEAAGLA